MKSLVLPILVIVIVAMAGAAADPDAQPLPFSHRKHAGELKLACKGCHVQPEQSTAMTFPRESICTTCHTDSTAPAAARLLDSVRTGQPIPWKRIYRVPSYVFWDHTPHVGAGISCEKCHGPVAQRDVLTREVSHRMADCIACHRASKVGTDCSYCHEQRN